MHNPLKGLPSRVLVDTNVLVDAAFVRNGAARRSLMLLSTSEYSAVIDETIEAEAIRIIRQHQRRFPRNIDLAQALSTFISNARILRLPPAAPISSTTVKPHDRHVVSAALQYSAWVLTSDFPLIVQLNNNGVEARLPFDVILEEATRNGRGPALADIVRIVAPTRHRGVLFARVIPGAWAGNRGLGRFTVCDIQNVGRVFYDTDSEEWGFEMPIEVSVRVKHPLQGQEQYAVCAPYNLNNNGGNVTLRSSSTLQESESASVQTKKVVSASSPGSIKVGSSTADEEHWNGHFRSVVVGPQAMKRETWKQIISIPEAAPNPFDNDMLSRVFQVAGAASAQAGFLILPTENDLRRLNL